LPSHRSGAGDPYEDEIALLVPGTMRNALAHSLLREDLCCVYNGFRQIE
jgi:hypothetical protein